MSKIVVLGGANMIGIELTRQLLAKNPNDLWVVDNLSAGKRAWVPPDVPLYELDLRYPNQARKAIAGADIVFLLACRHGGRGYVATHATELYDNFSLTATILRACEEVGVQKVVATSSACAYPINIQFDLKKDLKLSEHLIDYNLVEQPDGMYGMEKLMLEHALFHHTQKGSFDGVACRLFTVFGGHVSITHAIGAMMAKFMIRQNPFEIWGNGKQKRNWTYVKDTARGIILASEKLKSGPINIGSEEVNTPISAFEYLTHIVGGAPAQVNLLLDKPVGPYNRVADSSKARFLLGWEPEYTFRQGLVESWEIFRKLHTVDELLKDFGRKQTEL